MSGFVRSIEIDLLDRRADARAIDAGAVAAIAASFAEVGQMNPIRVRPRGERFEIVAGAHRVEACRALGLVEVEALIVDTGELFAELAMIDENLCRAELGPADRARQTARRKQIYEELHPETRHGATGGGHGQSRQVGDSAPRFTTDTAAATGASERAVQRDAERGARVAEEVLEAIAGTVLDTGVFLDELKQLDPDAQMQAVRSRRDLVNGNRTLMHHRVEPDDSLDYFPTPPWATRALIEHVLNPIGYGLGGDLVWEPACGEGHIAGVLQEYGARVVASDICDYAVDGVAPPGWAGLRDFLADGGDDPAPTLAPTWVITNPPFGARSLAFALKALAVARRGVALFVRQQWLEGVDRYEQLFSVRPPSIVAQFVERVPLHKGRWEPDGGTMTPYCWLVWLEGRLASGTVLRWIPPGRREALTRPDDVERFTAHPVRPPVYQGREGCAREAGEAPETENTPGGSGTAREAPGSSAPGDGIAGLSEDQRQLSEGEPAARSAASNAVQQQGAQSALQQPFTRFDANADAFLSQHYALPLEQFDLGSVAAAIGCSKLQARRRASYLGIARAEHQRAAVAEANRRRASSARADQPATTGGADAGQ